MFLITVGQTDTLTLIGRDKHGHPAPVPPGPAPTWGYSPAGLVSMTPSPDGMTCQIQAVTAGDGTISANCSGLTGSLDLTVAPLQPLPPQTWFDTNVQDPVIKSTGDTIFQDGVISRTDATQLLGKVADSGPVTQQQLIDLQLISKTPTLFGTLNYVQDLTAKVVGPSVANANFQGQPLGNLGVGDPPAKLQKLISKWFLGGDPPAAGSSYQTINVPLFAAGPTYTDVFQGGLGDCGLMTALSQAAYRHPELVQSMFVDNGDGTYTVRLFNNGVATYITVQAQLPAGYASYAAELWVALAEKAWAQFYELLGYGTNSYAGIAGTWIFDAMAHLTGLPVVRLQSLSQPGGEQLVIDAMNSGKMIGFATSYNAVDMVANHAYGAISYDPVSNSMTLYNPWGATAVCSWAVMLTNCVYYDRLQLHRRSAAMPSKPQLEIFVTPRY